MKKLGLYLFPENSTMKTRKRMTKSDSAPNSSLPQEIITEILLRLPTKSLGIFRCVSKQWRSLLSHPHFIKSHLTLHSIHNPPKLIIISSWKRSLFSLNFTLKSSSRRRKDAVSRKLRNSQEKWYSLWGSCHGLVLMNNNHNSKFLMNPTTLEIVKVPDFSLALDPFASYCTHGFGYDSSNDDYKIVTISYYRDQPDCEENFVDVYSLKMKTWRRIEHSPYIHIIPHLMFPGVFLHGAIHWLASDDRIDGSPNFVAAFNLSNENFEQVPAPSCFNKCEFHFEKLVVLGGCLGMFYDRERVYDYSQFCDSINIWVMKEYGVQESWTKFCVNIPLNTKWFKPVCQLGDEEVVLLKDGEKLVLHNLKEETSRDMVVSGMPNMYSDGIMTFSESLVSPSFRGWDGEA